MSRRLAEHVLGDRAVIVGEGGVKRSKLDSECLPVAEKFWVISVDDLLGRHALLVGLTMIGVP